ncbi:MAG: DnaB-like helicase C-terminal domain-containing protein [Synergistaceae bacterium]
MSNIDLLEIDKSCNVRLNNDDLKALARKEEPRFLSILLKDRDSLMDCMSSNIKPGEDGHFWMQKPRFLYSIIHEYYKQYGEVLTRTAMESIMDSLSNVGGAKIDDDERTTARMYFDEVYSLEAPISDYDLLRDHINSRYVQWQGFEIMKNEMESLVKATSGQDKLVKSIQERFLHIDNLEADSYCKSLSMIDAMPKVRDHIRARRENPEADPRIPTYINAIDKVYYLNPCSYTIVSGMINGGKTTFMFNVGLNMARAGHSVVYVSIEKEAMPLMIRLTALHALVDYNRIKQGGKGDYGLSDIYYDKLIEATKDLEENIKPNFHCIQAVPGTKLSKLISEVEKIKARHKIDVLIVDYLGVIGFETNHPGRPDLDEAIVSKRLQAYGKTNRFVTIAASQLKTPSVKEIRNKAKKATADDASQVEVNTEDLAGSKMIIADADNGISVILNTDSPATKMFVYGTKARDDEARSCSVLDFDGRIGRISDPEFDSGHIKEVDSLLYDDQITEEDLASDDGLFSSSKDAISDLNDDDFIFAEESETKENIELKKDPFEGDDLFEAEEFGLP